MGWLLQVSKRQQQWQEMLLLASPDYVPIILERCALQVRTWGHHPFHAGKLCLCVHWTISEMTCPSLKDLSWISYWECASTMLSISHPDQWVVWPSHNDAFWYRFKWHKLSVLQMQAKGQNNYYADCWSKSWPKGGRKLLQKGQVRINILWVQLCIVFLLNNYSFAISPKS